MAGWWGFDLDGTIAQYDGWKVDGSIGAPVASMIRRMKSYLKKGRDVQIVTARVNPKGRTDYPEQFDIQRAIIDEFCMENLGQTIPVGYEKDLHMVALFDDRALQVIPNTGRLVQEELGKAVRGLLEIRNHARQFADMSDIEAMATKALEGLDSWSIERGN